MSHTTKGFSIAEPGVADHGCSFCSSMEVHTVMEMVDHNGSGQWVSIPICIDCQKVITISLARDLAAAEGYADTPDEVAEFMGQLDWSGRDAVQGEDSPPKDGDTA